MKEILDKISELEQQLTALRAEVKEKEKKDKQDKRWRANRYENYWYVTDWGITITEEDIRTANSATDNYRYDTHNYFQTEEEARKYASVLETERQLRKFADKHNDKIDWEDIDQDKWCLGYSYRALKTMTAVAMYTRGARTIYFSSQEIAKQAIDEIGIDKIKEYLTYEW